MSGCNYSVYPFVYSWTPDWLCNSRSDFAYLFSMVSCNLL